MERQRNTAASFSGKRFIRAGLWLGCNLLSVIGVLQFAQYARVGNNQLGLRAALFCIAANRLGELFKEKREKKGICGGSPE